MKFPAFTSIDLKNNDNEIEDCSILDIELSNIIPDAYQARKIFVESELQELAGSIHKYGVVQPIIVKKIAIDKYQLISGERRWRASKIAGLAKIPAIIREYNKQDSMAVALIENIQRANLRVLEEARAIQNLLQECAMTHDQVAASIGKSRATVSNLLRLLSLEKEVQSIMNQGLLEMGHARALLGLAGAQQIEIAKLIVNKQASVRQTEAIIRQLKTLPKTQKKSISAEFKNKMLELERVLSRSLAANINVHFSSEGTGKITININSIEEINLLLENLVVLN